MNTGLSFQTRQSIQIVYTVRCKRWKFCSLCILLPKLSKFVRVAWSSSAPNRPKLANLLGHCVHSVVRFNRLHSARFAFGILNASGSARCRDLINLRREGGRLFERLVADRSGQPCRCAPLLISLSSATAPGLNAWSIAVRLYLAAAARRSAQHTQDVTLAHLYANPWSVQTIRQQVHACYLKWLPPLNFY